MREVKKKSPVPVYGTAALWLVYCLFFPLYLTWHFILLACLAAAGYIALSRFFPGSTEFVKIPEQPVKTGDEKIDELLADGEKAVAEMSVLQSRISEPAVQKKLGEIITVTDKIFKNLLTDPSDYRQVRRFSELFLPTTLKLLKTYDNLGKSGVAGDNISGTLERIDAVLDTILDSYNRFFDSLFENQALDIETDIKVLETMLKREGFSPADKDFQ